MIPFHAPSFCFQMKVMKEALITHHSAIPFHSCKGTSPPLKFVLFWQQARNPEGVDFLMFQTLHQLLACTVPYYNLCCYFPDFDSL